MPRARSRPRPGSPLPVGGTSRVRPGYTHLKATGSAHVPRGGPRALLAKAPSAHTTAVTAHPRSHRPTSRPTPVPRRGPPRPRHRPRPRRVPALALACCAPRGGGGESGPGLSHAAGRAGERGSRGGGGGPLMLRAARRLHCVRPPAGPRCPAPRSAAPREAGGELAEPAALRPPPSARPVQRRRRPAPPARSRGRPHERGCPGPGAARHRRQGAGPLRRRPVRGTAAEPAPATPARDAGPGQPPELEMPPRPRPPPLPSPAVPLPHVGRAAVSGPLPAPSRCH